MEDTRFVYGANCAWFGSISEIGKTPKRGPQDISLPCCPVCGSMLFEMPTEDLWWKNVDAHEAKGNPGYRKLVEWMRGKHFASYTEAKASYETAVKAH